jgi:Luciferase
MTARERIQTELEGWPEVESGPGRFGSIRFVLGRRELGHVHGDSVADLPLRPEKAAELIASGEAREHRWTKPGSGWVSIDLEDDDAIDRAIELMRSSYDRAIAKRSAA